MTVRPPLAYPREKSRTRCQYASTLTPRLYLKAETPHSDSTKNVVIRVKLHYNIFCVYRGLSVLCGRLITILATESGNSLWWYTVLSLNFSKHILTYLPPLYKLKITPLGRAVPIRQSAGSTRRISVSFPTDELLHLFH